MMMQELSADLRKPLQIGLPKMPHPVRTTPVMLGSEIAEEGIFSKKASQFADIPALFHALEGVRDLLCKVLGNGGHSLLLVNRGPARRPVTMP